MSILSLTSLLLILINTLHAQSNPSGSIQTTLQNTLPKVVTIYATSNELEIDPNRPVAPNNNHKISYGTGFFVSDNGFILTNAHVVANSKTLLIRTYDGHETTARLIGIDNDTDIALLKTPINNTPFITLDSTTQPRVGDDVFAIGNSLGLSHSVTKGIISAMHRNTSPERVEDHIQTDATIHMGNSGGPLINTSGELIGINNKFLAAQFGSTAGHFSIPTYMARNISLQLIQHGNSKPSLIGLVTQNLSQDIAQAVQAPVKTGVIVSEVIPGSAADIAKIQIKDIITHIDEDPIHTGNQMRATIYTRRAGSNLKVTLYRDGKKQVIDVTTRGIDELPAVNTPSNPALFSGIALERHASLNSSGQSIQGLKVTDLKEGSNGWVAGILPGDIIEKANNLPIKTLDDLQKTEQQANTTPILLEILRDSKKVLLAIAKNH